MKLKQAQLKKLNSRKTQCHSRLTCKPKHFPVNLGKGMADRPVMFYETLKEVKQEYRRKNIQGPRRERRFRMIDLARRTMRMMRTR